MGMEMFGGDEDEEGEREGIIGMGNEEEGVFKRKRCAEWTGVVEGQERGEESWES